MYVAGGSGGMGNIEVIGVRDLAEERSKRSAGPALWTCGSSPPFRGRRGCPNATETELEKPQLRRAGVALPAPTLEMRNWKMEAASPQLTVDSPQRKAIRCQWRWTTDSPQRQNQNPKSKI